MVRSSRRSRRGLIVTASRPSQRNGYGLRKITLVPRWLCIGWDGRTRLRRQDLSGQLAAVVDGSRSMSSDRLCARCMKQAHHRHHVRAKGLGGSKALNVPENLIWLCSPCHSWVHANPRAALEAGYRKLRNTA